MSLTWIIVICAAGILLGAAGGIAVLISLPKDYFSRSRSKTSKKDRPSFLRILARIGKNVAGVALAIAGVVLSLPGIPGPGLLLVFVGVLLVDFPGKHRLLQKVVRRRRIGRMLNRMRERFKKPEFIIPAAPKSD